MALGLTYPLPTLPLAYEPWWKPLTGKPGLKTAPQGSGWGLPPPHLLGGEAGVGGKPLMKLTVGTPIAEGPDTTNPFVLSKQSQILVFHLHGSAGICQTGGVVLGTEGPSDSCGSATLCQSLQLT